MGQVIHLSHELSTGATLRGSQGVGRGKPSQVPDLREELGREDDTHPRHGSHDPRRGVVRQQLLEATVELGEALPGS